MCISCDGEPVTQGRSINSQMFCMSISIMEAKEMIEDKERSEKIVARRGRRGEGKGNMKITHSAVGSMQLLWKN